MKKRIYYAHSMHLYGTLQEKRDIELLESLGFEVVNPNCEEIVMQVEAIRDIYEKSGATKDATSTAIMEYFYEEVIPDCDALAYRSFIDFKIGAGVYGEILIAKSLNKPIIELPTLITSRSLTVAETRQYLMLHGNR
jgi:hypothetical protein